MTDLLSMNFGEMQEFVRALGEKPYRAAQLYSWLHAKGAVSFSEMTNLPKTFRETLILVYLFHY